jgi:hypothetical protein
LQESLTFPAKAQRKPLLKNSLASDEPLTIWIFQILVSAFFANAFFDCRDQHIRFFARVVKHKRRARDARQTEQFY